MTNRYQKIIDKFQLHDWNDRSQRIPISEQHLLDVEKNLGHPLPNDYREFVQNFGGTSFSDIVFPLAAEQELDEASISGFNDSNTEEKVSMSINKLSIPLEATSITMSHLKVRNPFSGHQNYYQSAMTHNSI